MELHELIESIRFKTSSGMFRLGNYKKLIQKLEELDSMVEMKEVKKAFVSQLLLIIKMKRDGYRHPFKKMHSVLSGPPGVGKSRISIIMAEIWSTLGILNKDCSDDNRDSSPVKNKREDIASTLTKISDEISDIMMALNNEYSDKQVEDIPDVIKNIYPIIENSSDLCQELINRYIDDLEEYANHSEHDYTDRQGDAPYILIGRGDLIGTHQGHTSVKTQELLEKNKGKVIIIEEAYSLFTDERDSYGMEALTLLNRYMDENNDDYIFIFNGYSDMLERTIFRAQPGLKRRIQWTFKVNKYTYNGLFKIFQYQLERYKNPIWKVKDEDIPKLKEFFKHNMKYFPYFGGNTDNLIQFCQLTYGEEKFDIESLSTDSYILDIKNIYNSFDKYKIANADIVSLAEDYNPLII